MADQWSVSMNHKMGFIGFTAGSERFAFVMPLSGTKMFALNLQKSLEKLESEIGEIDTTDAPVHQMSPIQPK